MFNEKILIHFVKICFKQKASFTLWIVLYHTRGQTNSQCRDNRRCVVEICSIFSCRNRPSNTHSLQTHL